MRFRTREVQSERSTAEAPVEQDRHRPVEPRRKDTSGPIVRPPIAYACSLVSGLVLDGIWPLALSSSGVRESAGLLLGAGSIALFARSVAEFRKFGTPVPSSQPSTSVVRTGPYRFSRNPIYLAFMLLQVGVGLWAGNGWLLMLLVPTLALISRGVIDREERYLEGKFGQDYRQYRAKVRRWF